MMDYKNMTTEQLEARYNEIEAAPLPEDIEEQCAELEEYLLIGGELYNRRFKKN